MLEHWLQPVQTADIKGFESLEEAHFGRKIALHTEGSLPNLKTAQIALIGVDAHNADAVRAQLYALSFPFSNVSIVDLGNLRKQEISFVSPLLSELMHGGILPVLMGPSDIMTLAQFQAYHTQKKTVNLTVVDERIRFTPKLKTENYFFHHILNDKLLFNCSVVGFQSHFTDPSVFTHFEERHFELVRLGRLKNSIEDVEPVIRDADVVSVNLAVLKQSEAPAVLDGSPSGIFSEEICQIARYAGMSDKLTSFGIYGFHRDLDRDDQTAQIVAQMIWYFAEGFTHRKADFPISEAFSHLTQYIVDIKEFNYRLSFWKSGKSGRWWMEVPVKTAKKNARHRLVPCSYSDYLQACNGHLPERLLSAYRRF